MNVEVGETFRAFALHSSQPALGSSIDQSHPAKVTTRLGFDVSGTLGGYLELRKEEQSKVVGLTCHHVLLPPPDEYLSHRVSLQLPTP